MSGKRLPTVLRLFILGAVLLRPVPARTQDLEEAKSFSPSLGIEYFSRTLVWDEGLYTSKMTVAIGVLRAEREILLGFRFGLFAGYNLSNFNGLIFRQLPFSIDYEAGSIGSLLWGADLDKHLFTFGNIEIGAAAQFVMSMGRTKEFEIPSLNQNGLVKGKGTWQRFQAGPVVHYLGYEDFTPFLSITYNRLWGTFTMTETVQDLEGSEEKKITGRGQLGITIGTEYKPSERFSVKVDITAFPFNKLAGGLDVNYGASLKVLLSFGQGTREP